MIIPEQEVEKQTFLMQIIEKCMESSSQRKDLYEMFRLYYLFGTTDNINIEFNRIFSHIDLLSSFLFSGETMRFTIKIPEHMPEEEFDKADALNKFLHDFWHDQSLDLNVYDLIVWSLVYGSYFDKIIPSRNGIIKVMLCPPHHIGVLREDEPVTDNQEALNHKFYMSKGQTLEFLKAIEKTDMLDNIKFSEPAEEFPEFVRNVIATSQITTSETGFAGGVLPSYRDQAPSYSPVVKEPLAVFNETWIWDDKINDYKVFTSTEEGIILNERNNTFIPKELPFVKLTPNPLPFYYWGMSEIAQLFKLQDWRNERITQIKELLRRQVMPPKAFIGITGITDEDYRTVMSRGGVLSIPQAVAGNIQDLSIPPTGDLFIEISQIDAMFQEISGVRDIMLGKGERGVRAHVHADLLARLASSRVKKKALIIEDFLEKLGYLLVKCIKAYVNKKLKTAKGLLFIPAQFTDDFMVKIDSHSSSPIFVEDTRDIAVLLAESGLIDAETFIDLLNPPYAEKIKAKLKKQKLTPEGEKGGAE